MRLDCKSSRAESGVARINVLSHIDLNLLAKLAKKGKWYIL
jgi:hypothetical protein